MDLGMPYGMTGCTGAEVHMLADGTFTIRVVELSLHKKLIHISSKKAYTVTPDQIKIPGLQGPVAITMTGKGVLIRKTALLETITEQSLKQLFPGFKPEEFYLQHFRSGGNSFIAFVRKEIADPIIAAFKKQGIQVLLLGLGPFVVDQVIPQLNHYGGSLNFDGHQLPLDQEKAWLDYSYQAGTGSDFELKIDSELMEEQFLLAYASAFQLLLNDRLELIAVESEQIRQDLVELTAKLKFKHRGMLILFFFFALLLINFLLFSFYNAANQQLAGKAGQRSDLFTDRQKLEAEVKEKEAQVKLIGWNHGLSYAYLCDQIGQTIPAAVTLSELSIGGLKEEFGSAQKVSPKTGRMKITGQSASVYIIHDWIYALQQKRWVKAVQLESYATDAQQGAQVFTLLVSY